MAVHHMVWITFHENISDVRRQEHLDDLQGLANQIDVIEALHLGENFTDRAGGATHGLIVVLPDREALATYANHPAHLAVAGPLKEDAKLLAMDIEA